MIFWQKRQPSHQWNMCVELSQSKPNHPHTDPDSRLHSSTPPHIPDPSPHRSFQIHLLIHYTCIRGSPPPGSRYTRPPSSGTMILRCIGSRTEPASKCDGLSPGTEWNRLPRGPHPPPFLGVWPGPTPTSGTLIRDHEGPTQP